MGTSARLSILTLAAALAFSQLRPQPPAPQLHVPVAMRDAIRLSANVFLPAASGRVPTILIRTPYGKGTALVPNYQYLLDHGYAVVTQDVRGRYESEGVFDPLHQEVHDGDDTLNWIARQSWSDGKVGMAGGSYLGIAQWRAALSGNPHLKAIFPVVSGGDEYLDRFYSPGGALKLGNRLEWMAENLKIPGFQPNFRSFVRNLPLRSSDVAATGAQWRTFQDALDHPSYDGFWRSVSTLEQAHKIKVPAFAVGGWYDNFSETDLRLFAALRELGGPNRVLIGPWPHNMSYRFSGVDYGPEASAPLRALQLAWFDHWLRGKDSPLLAAPPAHVFVMGRNRWRDFSEWPPKEAHPVSLYLSSEGHANSLSGDGQLLERRPRNAGSDHFLYDPSKPVPTLGGSVCCNPKVLPWGPIDQRPVERRSDVLVYSTPRLRHDLEIAGPVKVSLWVSSSAPDTDFTAKLIDVFPDGTARNLTDGILRLRYRESLEHPEPAVPGRIYSVEIDAGATANVFRKGHSVRVEISSSNFPRFDRHPNTWGALDRATRLVPATQTIFHDREHPSRLTLLTLSQH